MAVVDGLQLYSDVVEAKKKENREKFESYLKLNESNFPSELIQGFFLTCWVYVKYH